MLLMFQMMSQLLLASSLVVSGGSLVGISNGINLQPSYYNYGNVTFGFDLMKQYPQIRTVRIEIEPDKVSQAQGWIRQAISNGYAVIATYHKYEALGSDDVSELLSAANWWVNNYDFLRAGGNFTMNVMNEWGSHDLDASYYSDAYNQALPIIRTVYQDQFVIVDIPGWGQECTKAAEMSPLLLDPMVMLSAHIYPQAWNEAAGR